MEQYIIAKHGNSDTRSSTISLSSSTNSSADSAPSEVGFGLEGVEHLWQGYIGGYRISSVRRGQVWKEELHSSRRSYTTQARTNDGKG